MDDPPRAPQVESNHRNEEEPAPEGHTEEEVSARRSRATRGTPNLVWPSIAEALSLRTENADMHGEIITVFASANYNAKQSYGEVTKIMQQLATDGEVRLCSHGLRPSQRRSEAFWGGGCRTGNGIACLPPSRLRHMPMAPRVDCHQFGGPAVRVDLGPIS